MWLGRTTFHLLTGVVALPLAASGPNPLDQAIEEDADATVVMAPDDITMLTR